MTPSKWEPWHVDGGFACRLQNNVVVVSRSICGCRGGTRGARKHELRRERGLKPDRGKNRNGRKLSTQSMQSGMGWAQAGTSSSRIAPGQQHNTNPWIKSAWDNIVVTILETKWGFLLFCVSPPTVVEISWCVFKYLVVNLFFVYWFHLTLALASFHINVSHLLWINLFLHTTIFPHVPQLYPVYDIFH